MIKRLAHIVLISIAFCTGSCKKPYTPEAITTPSNYLVVEGVINTGNDSTTIKLSRTTRLKDTVQSRPELNAIVYVEDDKNTRYNLKEQGKGLYQSPPLNLQSAQKCRLHIVTQGQNEYISDFVERVTTPPIDSITYTLTGSGMQIYTFTKDATNDVKYFRWDYDETWEYISYYYSIYKYENGKVLPRLGENVFYCWTTDPSSHIVLGSAAGLSQSVINAQPIAYIDESTGKLAQGYSMLLKEYALTKEAFEYWQKLKKNTEQLGSIFDAQPSDLRGNLHSLKNPAEPVLGYISASNVSSKRFIIGHNSIPIFTTNYYPPPTSAECDSGARVIGTLPAETFSARLANTFASGDSALITDKGGSGTVTAYTYAPVNCVDCRAKIKNGTNKKPAFWPDVL